MAKPDLGGKHQCQNCGTKFFDLHKDPITCPKCGTVFQPVAVSRTAARAAPASTSDDDDEAPAEAGAEIVSLEDAEAGDEKATVAADDDVEIEEAGEDTFLEEEEESSDDVADLIDGDIEDDEER